jgi:hypothetical protein
MREVVAFILVAHVTAASALLNAASLWKIRHRHLFRGALRAQGLHSSPLLAFLPRAVPIAEVCSGAGLYVCVQTWAEPPAMWRDVILVVSAFGAALFGYVLIGSIRFGDKPCGCLSPGETFGLHSFVRAGLVAAAGPAALTLLGSMTTSPIGSLPAQFAGVVLAAGLMLGPRGRARVRRSAA